MAISKEQMKDMYVKMRRIRDFESTAARLFAEGKIPGFVHLYLGEEAIAPAVCECLRDDDFITSTHRGHGHIIAKGGDLNLMMAELFGRETGYCKGKGGSMHIADRDKGILGANGIVGAGHCISCGAGLSAKIRGTDQVCVCFFGDGSTNQGTFHESLNMASIWKLPIIFVCENNHYGISMSQDRHQAIKDVAPGFHVSATSPDGIIEAMEGRPAYPIFSVQWHPEKMAVRPDQQMQRLFHYFVNEAKLFARAKNFHEQQLVVDSHCDTPMKFTEDFDFSLRHNNVKVDLPKMQEGLEDAVFMVAYLHQEDRDENSLQAATQKAIDILYQIAEQAKRLQTQMGIAYSADDLVFLKNAGKKAIFLGIENGYALGKDLSNLTLFKNMGVSYITLCHNGDNDICDSAKGNHEHNGLSDFGRKVVTEMNRLGIIVDISHAGDKTVSDVLEISTAPIIASHSSCRSLCNHPRNLTDEQIRAIAAKGGVIQICLYGPFLKDSGEATIEDAIAHINHVVQLVGIEHVGIGTDFDGDDEEKLTGCRAANELPRLTMELLRQGYSETDLARLWGGNLLRVLNTVQAQQEQA